MRVDSIFLYDPTEHYRDVTVSVAITIQYFDGCPHWKNAHQLLGEVLDEAQIAAVLKTQVIDTPELAQKHSFRGSPTILINGHDPFADPDAPIGLSCRFYITPDGTAGTPTKYQMKEALLRATRGG